MNDVNNRNIHLQHKWMQTQFALSQHLLIKGKAISDRNHSRLSKFKQQFQGKKWYHKYLDWNLINTSNEVDMDGSNYCKKYLKI